MMVIMMIVIVIMSWKEIVYVTMVGSKSCVALVDQHEVIQEQHEAFPRVYPSIASYRVH